MQKMQRPIVGSSARKLSLWRWWPSYRLASRRSAGDPNGKSLSARQPKLTGH